MPITFTKHFQGTIFFKALLFNIAVCCSLLAAAQKDSTVKKIVDSGSNKTSVRSKDIIKLEDVGIPPEMFAKIKTMKPNQLVAFRESYTYNIKADDGIEYSITIKLGFSQDKITGIIRWVPLYASNNAPPEVTQIKIPIKFCCTTKIDTMHKKQHCGKMSELNDFEDYEHCKDWIQMEDAGKNEKDAIINKKGGKGTGKDSTGGFGKPEKPLSKKELKKRKKDGLDIDDASDSTGVKKDSTGGFGKPEKPSKKDSKKKKGKDEIVQQATDSAGAIIPAAEPPVKSKKGKEEKKPKKEEVKKDSTDEGSYGKPAPPAKESKKKKSKDKEKPEPTDLPNYRPEPTAPEAAPVKEEKKVEEVKKDSADGGGFGKPEDKKSKKKKKEKNKKEPTDTASSNLYEEVPAKENKEKETIKEGSINGFFSGEMDERKTKKKR